MRRRLAALVVSTFLASCSDAAFDTASAGDDAGDDVGAIDSSPAPDVTSDLGTDSSDSATAPDTPADSIVSGEGAVDAPARDLCKGVGGLTITTDRLVIDPDPVKLGSSFVVYVVSQKTLPNLTINIGGSYCAGGSGFSAVTAGPGCKDFFAAKVTVDTGPLTKPVDKSGVYSLEVFVDDPDAPCTPPFNRKITGSITVNP